MENLLELDYLEIDPEKTATASVIWLHGLGADGHDFAPVVPALELEGEERLRFVFPHAPHQPVTLNNGITMPAWFDLYGLHLDAKEDETGLQEASTSIATLIEREIERGIPSQRIFIAGFSQGGALALYVGLRYPKPLAGIIALSTYLPVRQKLAQETSSSNRKTPIFMAHGTQDEVVPLLFAEISREVLSQGQNPLSWKTYPMAHNVSVDEIEDIRVWIEQRF